MLFPAVPEPASAPAKLSDLACPQPVMLQGEETYRRLLWRALFTLGIGVILAAAISAIYATGIIRMLGVETPLLQTPGLAPHFGVVSLIFTASIIWMAFPDRGRFARTLSTLISGVAPGITVGHGIRLLARYRAAMKLHRQII